MTKRRSLPKIKSNNIVKKETSETTIEIVEDDKIKNIISNIDSFCSIVNEVCETIDESDLTKDTKDITSVKTSYPTATSFYNKKPLVISQSHADKLLADNPPILCDAIKNTIKEDNFIDYDFTTFKGNQHKDNNDTGNTNFATTPLPIKLMRDIPSVPKSSITPVVYEPDSIINNNNYEETPIIINDKYNTRDISWLDFNERVLGLAKDISIPILERIKFLAISSSNLDEFSMVRLVKLMNKVENCEAKSILGIEYKDEYKYLVNNISTFLDKQSVVLEVLLTALRRDHKISFIKAKKLMSIEEKKFIKKYFKDKVQSMLTPLVFDNSRPFPLIMNNSLYIGVIIDLELDKNMFGTVQVPTDLERVIEIDAPSLDGSRHFILLEDLIKMNLDRIFIDKIINKTCVYRVLRNYDYAVDGTTVFLADEIEEKLKRRQTNDIIRLDISGNKKEFTEVLHKALHINKKCINKTNTIIDLTFGFSIQNIKLSDKEKEVMLYPPFLPQLIVDGLDEFSIFDRIDKDDIMIHHPYESYETVLDFIKASAEDDNVVAIKQTLYRVSNNSEIMQALITAAEKGKHVTVLLEIKARFDEENNLQWATRLEKSGGHVIYGVSQLKTHCKMCLVVRRSKKGNLQKYVHIGTGNYNENNAKIYEDISLLTSKDEITDDIEKLFNYLTGFSSPKMDNILFSPISLYTGMIKRIDLCIKSKKEGKPSKIIIKVNGLTDKTIIDKLYEAGEAGVEILLLVRSACSIFSRPNITIKSIVGRYLEHSRIYYFKYDDKEELFISSSDLMERNLYRRIEIAVPILDKENISMLKWILDIYEEDNTAYVMNNKEFINNPTNTNNSQQFFINYASAFKKHNPENMDKIFSRPNKQ